MHWWNNEVWYEEMFKQIKRKLHIENSNKQKSLLVRTCHFRWYALEGWQKNSAWPSCANSSAPSSIRSWILFLNAQQLLVSCPGLLEWYAHIAFGLYLGEAMLGFWGGSLNITNLAFNMRCNAWVNDMLISVKRLLDVFFLCRLPYCRWRGYG